MKLEKKIVYYDNRNINYEYLEDEQGRKQGEYKNYWPNGNLCYIGFCKDNTLYGKWTLYALDESLDEIRYYWEYNEVSKTEFVFRSKSEGSK